MQNGQMIEDSKEMLKELIKFLYQMEDNGFEELERKKNKYQQ